MIGHGRYRAILAELPDVTRAIFLLRRADGLDYRRIAALCGIAVTDVECHRSSQKGSTPTKGGNHEYFTGACNPVAALPS